MSHGQGNGARGGKGGKGRNGGNGEGGADVLGGNWAVDRQHATGVEGSLALCTGCHHLTMVHFIVDSACWLLCVYSIRSGDTYNPDGAY